MHDAGVVKESQMAGIHVMTNRFLEESFSAKKVDLNGAEYTSLVDLMRTARS
jgi:hypothetical protein